MLFALHFIHQTKHARERGRERERERERERVDMIMKFFYERKTKYL